MEELTVLGWGEVQKRTGWCGWQVRGAFSLLLLSSGRLVNSSGPTLKPVMRLAQL